MKLLILVLLIPSIIGFNTYTPSIAYTKLYIQINKANPDLPTQYLRDLTEAILSVSERHNIKPHKLAAILAQESAYKLNSVNKLTKDYGIGQINIRTIKAFKFDKNRILTDLYYSIECAGIVLADFKRMYGKKDKDYWSRYNSSRPEARLIYKQYVERYL